MCDEIYALRYELNEARAEIGRHHFDLERISGIVDQIISNDGFLSERESGERARKALKEIRNIVG